ncbi:MAG: SpoIIE family protein phosphatase [Mycobacteriales bacterium]
MRTPGGPVAAQRPSADASLHDQAQRLLPRPAGSPELGRLTDLAAQLLSASGPTVSVQVSMLTDVQTIAGGSGPDAPAVGSQGPLADSLCTVTATLGAPLVVPAAAEDARVAHLSPVTIGVVGAYLGVPIFSLSGEAVGALCAYSRQPRAWSDSDRQVLEGLASAVLTQLELDAISGEYRNSQLRWGVAIDAAGIGSFDWDMPTGRLDWDQRMQTLFGFLPGEFEPHIDRGFERIHPEDRPRVDAAIAAAVHVCGDYRAEFRVVMPGGDLRWVAARGRAFAGPDGSAAQLIGTAYDITEVRTARDDAARLLETMATGFASVDKQWTFTYLNAEGARVAGSSAEQLVGRNLWEAFPGIEESEFGELYRHAVATGETGQLEAYYAHLDSWFEVRAVPDSSGLGLYFLDVTPRRRSQERAEATASRLELIARVSKELAAAGLDAQRAVARLAQALVPALADGCVVSLVAETGDLIDVGCWHADPQRRPLLETLVAQRNVDRREAGALPEAQRTGRPVIISSGLTEQLLPQLGSIGAREALTLLAPESVVVLPLTARDEVVGVLALLRGADRPCMSDEEITTAEEVAARAGAALESARLYTEQRHLATALQESLLTKPPEPDHCQIVVRYVPASQLASVGGDWYDSFLQPDGATVLVIGDVMGHDTVAAAAMGQVRGLLRGIAWHSGAAPAIVLSGLDAAMEGLQVDTTASVIVARLEQTDEEEARGVTRLRWSNAGHPPPMVINPDGSVLPLPGTDVDLLLGIDPSSPRTESVVVLDRGSTVLLYTDGLVERRGQDLDAGLAQLREVLGELADRPLDELCALLLSRMLADAVEDDVALIAVRLHRQDQPRPPEAGPEVLPPHVS